MKLTKTEDIIRKILFDLHVASYSPQSLLEIAQRNYGYKGSLIKFFRALARIDEYQNNFPTIESKQIGNEIAVRKTGPSKVVAKNLSEEEIILGKFYRLGATSLRSALTGDDLRNLYPHSFAVLLGHGKLSPAGEITPGENYFYIPRKHHGEAEKILKKVAQAERQFNTVNRKISKS